MEGNAKINRSLQPNDVSLPEIDIKVVCVGPANTGKTTFLRYWETGQCPRRISTTIQMEFHRREMTITVPPWSYFHERDQEAEHATPSRSSARNHCSSDDSDGEKDCSSSENHYTPSKTLSPSLPNPFGADFALSPPPPLPFHRCARRHPPVSLPAIVKVWDIQGQESTKRMTRVFYTGAVATLIFCELSSSADSLASALSWHRDAREKIRVARSLPTGAAEVPAPSWLVVNKYDLLARLPAPPLWASRPALDALCARHGLAGWSYAAGSRGVNVEETVRAVIAAAAEALPERVGQAEGATGDGERAGVGGRTRWKGTQRQRGGCCQ